MGDQLQSMVTEVAVIDERIGRLRAEIKECQESRLALVHTIEAAVGLQSKIEIDTPTASVTISPRKKVSFPTASGDASAQQQLVTNIRQAGLWDRYSMLSYPKLKSEWLHNEIQNDLRVTISSFAFEESELVVRCRPNSSYTQAKH